MVRLNPLPAPSPGIPGEGKREVAPLDSSAETAMSDLPLKQEILATEGHARLTRITTRHGSFETPVFMPVGTQGTVKGILPDQLAAAGARLVLGNTYHLMLRPGPKTVAALGDLHRFMAWPGS